MSQRRRLQRSRFHPSHLLRLAGSFMALCLSLSGPLAAQAQSGASQQPPRSYQKAVDEGIDEFSLGNYVEARALFLRAHEILPSARSLRALAKVEFELRSYLRCLEYIEAALGSDVRPLTAAMREEMLDLQRRAQGFVATVEFAVTPAEVRLRIDGRTRELSPEGTLQLMVGTHTAVVAATGYHTTQVQLEVRGGQDRIVTVDLAPLAAENSGQAETQAEEQSVSPGRQDAPRVETNRRRRRWAWTLAALAVVVGASVGAGVALSRREPGAGEWTDTGVELTVGEMQNP